VGEEELRVATGEDDDREVVVILDRLHQSGTALRPSQQ
jgi:hypothetical protein